MKTKRFIGAASPNFSISAPNEWVFFPMTQTRDDPSLKQKKYPSVACMKLALMVSIIRKEVKAKLSHRGCAMSLEEAESRFILGPQTLLHG